MTQQYPICRILLAEPNEIFLCGFLHHLDNSPDIHVVVQTSDADEAVALCEKLTPDVAVISSALGPRAFDAITKISAADPDVHCLYTTYRDDDASAAIAAGARGVCCASHATFDQICMAIRSVGYGAGWLDSHVARPVLDTLPEKAETSMTLVYKNLLLTPRELQVLKLLAEGRRNYEIAEQLLLTSETVRSHIKHIMDKLQVRDRTQAAVKALRENIVPMGIHLPGAMAR